MVYFILIIMLTYFFRYLASGCCLRDLQYNYLISKFTAAKHIRQVCDVLWYKLKNIVMAKPTREKWVDISNNFEKKSRFPNCLGALDGKHIRLIQPENSGSLYYNYKNYFSLVLMTLADANYSFIWVDIGSYGKCSDSRVFKNSTLYDKLTKNILNIPEPKPPNTPNTKD